MSKKTANTKTANSIPDEVMKDLEQMATSSSRKGNTVGKTINASVVGASSGALGAILTGKAFVETPILWGLLGSTATVSWPVLLTWAGTGAAVSVAGALLGEAAKAKAAKSQKSKKIKEVEKYL